MPKFTVITLGCKVNQYESEAIVQALKSNGWAGALAEEPPDICIINTCTVTGRASQQSRQAIRHALCTWPDARVIVTGCYAQTESEEIRKIRGVHAVVGHGDKNRIPEMIRTAGFDGSGPLPKVIHRDALTENRFHAAAQPVWGCRTRPFLKIQDGCNAFCTYCIVPYARGPSRSMPPDRVIDHVRALKHAGYHEVVLSGIHVGAYGLDLTPKTGLFALLEKLDALKIIERVRLSSIEPRELTPDIRDLAARSDLLCPHFHIPLQSGDNRILNRMHRPYTREFFRELVFDIREKMPDAAIGVDVLVGFPGETEEAFQNSYRLIEELPVSYLHVFRFSPRPGTPAAALPHPVPSQDIKRRSQNLIELGNAIKSSYYNTFLNKTVKLLVEQAKDNGICTGRTNNYVPVFFKGSARMVNTLAWCRIETIDQNGRLWGSVRSEVNDNV